MRGIVVLSCLIFSVANAQITVTTADFGSLDDTIRYSETPDVWGLDPTGTGANLTWDFSVMMPVSQRVDTLYGVAETGFANMAVFGNPFDQPHLASWGKVDLSFDAGGVVPVDDAFGFYKKNSGAFEYVGAAANVMGIPIPAGADTIETVYPLPLNYNDQYNGTRYIEISVPSLGYFSQYRTVQSYVEAWGTLITPYGSFQTLKVRKEIDEVDSIYVDSLGFGFNIPRPHVTEYHWLANGKKLPVMIYSDLGIGGATIEYQDSLRSTLGINDDSNSWLQVYPNPVNELMNIEGFAGGETVMLVASDGRLVYNVRNSVLGRFQINTGSLPSGAYHLLVINEGGFISRKVMITR
jgi:hypothetical protein